MLPGRAIVLVFFALVMGVVVGRVWREPPSAPPIENQSRQPPAFGLREATIVLRHKGAKQAEVTAASVAVSRDLRYATFRRVEKVTLFDQGDAALSLSTGEIVLDRSTNDLIARGNVTIAAPNGDRLWAPEARWINSTQRLVFPQGVRLNVGGAEVRASRLNVDSRLRIFDLEGRVDITFHLPPPP